MNQQSLKFIQALKDHADILSKYLEEHPEALARIVSELPTHQEPKKVTVADELTNHFDSKGALLTPYGYAVSAIEFMSNRMPMHPADPMTKQADCRYCTALKDVRQALFGEA